ncbi:hypothetical protein CSB20_07625 [bacterium DOLZORAL124_64_63]|nr:MAG: hypothetical protein CSB20_07625 [bacterium DOLZORAL124_64_63]
MLSRLFNRQAQRFAGIDFLDLIPVGGVPYERDPADQRVVLLMPRYRDFFFGRLIQPRLGPEKRFVRMKLDARGSYLWGQMDGRRRIGDLVAGFREAFPEDGAQAPERISGYLYNMYEQKLLIFKNLR